MSGAKELGTQVVLENKVVRTSKAAVEDAIMVQKVFAAREGVSDGKRRLLWFMDFFPGNVLMLFLGFLVLLALINAGVGAAVGALQPLWNGRSRKELLEEIGKQSKEDGDVAKLAAAKIELKELDEYDSHVGSTQGSIMTVLSLTVAIAGIFSLPLITSASIRLTIMRALSAHAEVAALREANPKITPAGLDRILEGRAIAREQKGVKARVGAKLSSLSSKNK
jgi:hypothetical protein